ncbi:sensor histidine kinase [Paenibacillus hamazuiensis]|uniref:sensor histidine kinase n=1 Tax=Paenibacillus hamazuiensis TaxID=2936508 RepID=UPI00200D4A2C|nr:sensor histidine kinase [Paenibacillus hamazuiensis]
MSINEIDRAAKRVSYSTTVQQFLLTDNPSEYFKLKASATEVLYDSIYSSKHIKSIVLTSRNMNNFYISDSFREIREKAMAENGLARDITLRSPIVSNVFFDNSNGNNGPYFLYFLPVRSILEGYSEKRNIALCTVVVDLKSFTGELSTGISSDGITALVFEDKIINSSREVNEVEQSILLNAKEGRGKASINGEKYLTSSVSVPEFGWRFVSLTTRHSLIRELIPIKSIGIFIILAAGFLLFLQMQLVLRSVTNPIDQIIGDMRNLSLRKDRVRISIPKIDELARLAEDINDMLERIELSQKEIRKSQQNLYQSMIAQQKAELLSYRSQINPHFLFNTLECVRSMAQAYGVRGIEDICTSMASMFRYSISSRTIVTLQDEIKHTCDYMKVMSQRFPGKYTIKLEIQPEAMNHPIHAMFLQPIVENSIKHGFAEKMPPCIIRISGRLQNDGSLLLNIADNGAGISDEDIKKINDVNLPTDDSTSHGKTNIGLYNIQQRLRNSFGDQYRFEVRSVKGHYTKVVICIPKALTMLNPNFTPPAC